MAPCKVSVKLARLRYSCSIQRQLPARAPAHSCQWPLCTLHLGTASGVPGPRAEPQVAQGLPQGSPISQTEGSPFLPLSLETPRPPPPALSYVSAGQMLRLPLKEAGLSRGLGGGQRAAPPLGTSPHSPTPALPWLPKALDPSILVSGPHGPRRSGWHCPLWSGLSKSGPQMWGFKTASPWWGHPILLWLDGEDRSAWLGVDRAAVPQALLIRDSPALPPPKIRQEELTLGHRSFPRQLSRCARAARSRLWRCPSLFSGRVICIPEYSVFSFCPAWPCTQQNQFWRVWFWSVTAGPREPQEARPRESIRGQGPQTRGGAGHPPRLSKCPGLPRWERRRRTPWLTVTLDATCHPTHPTGTMLLLITICIH